MDHIIKAVLSTRSQDLASLLRKTPAMSAMRFDGEFLIEEIPHQFYAGDTPLHLTAAAIRAPAVKSLLDAGADVDAANRRGARPLHYACDPRPAHDNSWRPAEQESVTPLHRAVRAEALSPSASSSRLVAMCGRALGSQGRPPCISPLA